MIFKTGNFAPSLEQIKHANKHCDDSFCASSNDSFNRSIPNTGEWKIAGKGILLRLRNVEPHDDPWVSNGSDPSVRRALFWLIHANGKAGQRKFFNQTKLNDVWFGCGKSQVKMKVGDWALFDDSKKHWVMSDHIWRGASWQLRKTKIVQGILS